MYCSTQIMITQALLVCAVLGGARAFGNIGNIGNIGNLSPSCQGQCGAGFVFGFNQQFCMCGPM